MIGRRAATRPIQRISRRGLIGSGMLAGVLTATGVPLMAQSRGGVLRLGLGGSHADDGWDPRRQQSAFMRVIGQGAVYDCLTEISATGELTGELAESWDAGPDAMVWRFNMRRDVLFHDGTPFGADDVVASLMAHVSPGFTSPVRSLVSQIASMEIRSSHQLQFTLVAPNVDFPLLLADPHLVIAPAGQFQSGVGTGLYRVARFEPGHSARLIRLASHYKDGRAGWFDAVEVTSVNHGPTRMQLLLDGRVDVVNRAVLPMVDELRATHGVRVIDVTGTQHLIASLPAAADDRSKAALVATIDRQAVVDALLAGHGSIARDNPLAPLSQRMSEKVEFDLDQAVWVAARAGISVAPADLHWRLSAGRLTEDWALSVAAGPRGAWSETLGGRRDFSVLLHEARSSFDSDRRRTIYEELRAMCQTDGGVCVPAYVNHVDAYSVQLAHPDVLGNLYGLDSGRIIERWWFT